MHQWMNMIVLLPLTAMGCVWSKMRLKSIANISLYRFIFFAPTWGLLPNHVYLASRYPSMYCNGRDMSVEAIILLLYIAV